MDKDTFLQEYNVDRHHTDAIKWDGMEAEFGQSDLIPLWIADTEFALPKAAKKALLNRIEHGAFGYSLTPKSYYDAYFKWQKDRYQIELHQDWMRFGTGVVQSIVNMLQVLTEPDDSVMIMQPVYYPFANVIKNNRRQLVVTALKNDHENYTIDFDDMAQKMESKAVKVLILCSPHNPVGRVWSESELEAVFALCQEKHVRVICDEIHHDLIVGQRPFVSALSIKDGLYRDNLVVLDSPSKTFNMSSLLVSHVIIPNPQIRRKYDQFVLRQALPQGSLLGKVAAEAAYHYGQEWLDGLLEVVKANEQYVREHLLEAYPEIEIAPLEGTYLLWVNLKKVVPEAKLKQVVQQKAHLAVDFGAWFGHGGAGHIRLNLATEPRYVKEAISALICAIDENHSNF